MAVVVRGFSAFLNKIFIVCEPPFHCEKARPRVQQKQSPLYPSPSAVWGGKKIVTKP